MDPLASMHTRCLSQDNVPVCRAYMNLSPMLTYVLQGHDGNIKSAINNLYECPGVCELHYKCPSVCEVRHATGQQLGHQVTRR